MMNNSAAELRYKEFKKVLEKAKSQGELQETLYAMAKLMQYELSSHETRKVIPHSPALEVIMRAVMVDIEGGRDMKDYILEKLSFGLRQFTNR